MRAKTLGRISLLALPVFAGVHGCSGGDGKNKIGVNSELLRMAENDGLAFGGAVLGSSANAFWSPLVEIESYVIPVRAIGLSKGEDTETGVNLQPVYVCEESAAACEIDLQAGGVQQNLFPEEATAELSEGTYTFMQAQYAFEENAFDVGIHARVLLGGEVWYTAAGSEYLTTDSSQHGTASIHFEGAIARADILQVPLTLEAGGEGEPQITRDGDGQEVKAKVFDFQILFDLRSSAVAFAADAPRPNNMFCTVPYPNAPNGSAPYLCIAFPFLSGAVVTEIPALQRYSIGIAEDGTPPYSFGIAGLYLDSAGNGVSAYGYPYFPPVEDAGQAHSVFNYGTKKFFTAVAGSSYELHFGRGSGGLISDDGDLVMENVPLLPLVGSSALLPATMQGAPIEVLFTRLPD